MPENSTTDINGSIMERLENVSDDTKVEITDTQSDDEFEKLLNSFIASEKSDVVDIKEDPKAPPSRKIPAPLSTKENIQKEPSAPSPLGTDEEELAQAYQNMVDSITAISEAQQIEMPHLMFDSSKLSPNYKPSLGRQIVQDTLLCWDLMFAAFPEKLSTINPNATDEQFLNFAEGLSDQNLQLAIISYVEILIDIENCEISYEERRLKAQRKRIERALYEEYQRRRERKLKFIEAIAQKDFPIDAERLINNYFKTATKDPKAAFEVLTTNPAVYAPIQNEKIKPRLFGLIKVTPEDGIKENHRIGAFLKKLRV